MLFKQIKMATYLFDGSYMCGFLKYHGFTYTTETFGKKGKDFKSLIQIVNDDKLNMEMLFQVINLISVLLFPLGES